MGCLSVLFSVKYDIWSEKKTRLKSASQLGNVYLRVWFGK